MSRFSLIVSLLFLLTSARSPQTAEPGRLSVLMLGDTLNQSGHEPERRGEILIPAMASRGIDVAYTNDVRALNAQNLARFDCLLLYNNLEELPGAAESALLEYVERGKGLVVLHCASFAFRNSTNYVALVGGQFASHGNEVFRPFIIDAQHPATRGQAAFEVKDESYVHTKLGKDIRVLTVRPHADGFEPWTWVRQQGQGRVFYTASGHYAEIWRKPEFQNQVEAGLRWAAGRTHETAVEFKRIPARVPRYTKGAAWGTQSEDFGEVQAPLTPADSMKLMHFPEGLRIELFAAEPNIVKPMAMTWDERGRLWVVESVDYPNNLMTDPHQNGNDRIKICEDTDGDGRADKFTVFADKLNIPTGIVLARGGAILTVAPHLLFLKDTNGDDVADTREILYTGLGRNDTHAVASNLHYGHDNWIYGAIGYSGGTIRVGENSTSLRSGYFRFRPDGSAFEFLTATSNNTWGFGFNEDGEPFGSTANNDHCYHLAIPNRYFEAVRGWHGQGSATIEDHKEFHPITEDVRQVDWFGRFTAASDFTPYTARALPSLFWNQVGFVCEPTGHLIHSDRLVRRGTAFAAREGWNLFASRDAWTAPVYAQIGPDGGVWIADWYNAIIQHNPTPRGFRTGPGNAYESPHRDKEHGRVYRLVPEGAKPGRFPNLAKATPAELTAQLASDNLFWRLTAQRVMVDRGQRDVIPALLEVVRKGENAPATRHALLTLEGLSFFQSDNAETREVLAKALSHSAPTVCRAALVCLPRVAGSPALILQAGLLRHADLPVRKDALLALAEMPPSPEAAQAIAAALNDPAVARDRWLPMAATAAAARNDEAFLRNVAQLRIEAACLSVVQQTVAVCAEHLARGSAPIDLAALLSACSGAPAGVSEKLIAGLAAGWQNRPAPILSPQMQKDLSTLRGTLPLEAQLQLASLAKRWGASGQFLSDVKEIKTLLLARLANASETETDRIRAARDLMTYAADAGLLDQLLGMITPQTSPEMSVGLLNATGLGTLPETAPALIARWNSYTPLVRKSAVNLLLTRADWTRALLEGVAQGRLPSSDLNIEQVQRLTRNPEAAIAERATAVFAKGGRLPNADRQKVVEQLLPLTLRRGDPASGKEVFEKNCVVCHRLNGTGGVAGPDLTGFAGGNREEILINVLDPNASVEGNFRQFNLEMSDGQSLSGLLVNETRTTVELLDSQGVRHALQRADIKTLAATTISLMPEGFENLPPEELTGLLEFMTARGRFAPLALQRAANATSSKGLFVDPTGSDRLVFDNWSAKTFSGIPFNLIEPKGDATLNVIVLNSPMTPLTRQRETSASISCGGAASAIHLLSGVSGWGYPASREPSVSMIVRLRYQDGQTEEHPLTNGVHFADYIRRVDVPGSQFAAELLGGKQIRLVSVHPKRTEPITRIDFVKGPDRSAPVIMAVTLESPGAERTADATPAKRN